MWAFGIAPAGAGAEAISRATPKELLIKTIVTEHPTI